MTVLWLGLTEQHGMFSVIVLEVQKMRSHCKAQLACSPFEIEADMPLHDCNGLCAHNVMTMFLPR